ncbi:Synerg-CTERM sorting domain-containing protein [Cloacibacillus porcorum]|uniref:Synerg-CTERM sorting domain-containing protein n=1 Tax=Cloacibacillus porcorum TaxID=1197717 RepID=UPI003F0DFDE5
MSGCYSPASADLLYTRQDQSYSNTALGIIQGANDPVSPLVSNIGGNMGQGLYPFLNNNGKFRVAVSLYTINAKDVINIYNPGTQATWGNKGSWTWPLKEVTTTLSNIRGMTSTGDYLYGVAYDVPVVNRVTTANDSFAEDKVYTFVPDGQADAHGEGLTAYGGDIFAIFSQVEGDPWTDGVYLPNKLVKFDSELNAVASMDMKGKNLDGSSPGSYVRSGKNLYVATLGGVQPFGDGWNPESCIEIVNLNTMEVSQAVSADTVSKSDPTFKHMFTALAVCGEKVYVQATRWTSVDPYTPGYNIRIYETSKDELAKGNIGTLIKTFAGEYGWRCALVYDDVTGYLWSGTGYSICRYDGSEWKEFNENSLGGIISAYVPMSATDDQIDPEPTPDGGGSGGGGGCNGGMGMMALAALIPVLIVSRRKRFF